MSVSRKKIAEYYRVNEDDVRCSNCHYGEGRFLIECKMWRRIMGVKEYCQRWTRKDKPAYGVWDEDMK